MRKANNQEKNWKPLGTIGKPHGLKGFFYVHGRNDLFPEAYEEVLVGESLSRARRYRISEIQVHKGRSILALEQVQSRTALEPLVGMQIWGPSDVEEHPLDQLVGLEVQDSSGTPFARVTGHYMHGAAPNLELKRLNEPQTLDIPLVDAYFDLNYYDETGSLRLTVALDIFQDMWETPKGRA